MDEKKAWRERARGAPRVTRGAAPLHAGDWGSPSRVCLRGADRARSAHCPRGHVPTSGTSPEGFDPGARRYPVGGVADLRAA